MATTLAVFTAQAGVPPATSGGQPTVITGAASPAEIVPVIALDGGSTDEHVDFFGVMPQDYAGGGVTVVIAFAAAVNSGNIRWGAAFRSIEDDAEDMDTTAHSYDYNEVTDAVPSAIGEMTYAQISFTDGADMDSVGAGDGFVLRVRREASDATNDTAAGDAHLFAVEIRE